MDTASIIGKRFGKLSAISLSDRTDKSQRPYFLCVCDCGREIVTNGYLLTSGRSKSCGCSRKVLKRHEDRSLQIKKRLYQNRVVNGSRYRGLEANISFDDFCSLIEQPCHYCGQPPSGIFREGKVVCAGGKGKRLISDTVVRFSGLDRVDNARGYTPDNVVPCCKVCNLGKRAMTCEEFKAWISRAYHHMNN